jgi:hypothetical protein
MATFQQWIQHGDVWAAKPELLAQPIGGAHHSTGARVLHSATPRRRTLSIVAEIHEDTGKNSLIRDKLGFNDQQVASIVQGVLLRPPIQVAASQQVKHRTRPCH